LVDRRVSVTTVANLHDKKRENLMRPTRLLPALALLLVGCADTATLDTGSDAVKAGLEVVADSYRRQGMATAATDPSLSMSQVAELAAAEAGGDTTTEVTVDGDRIVITKQNCEISVTFTNGDGEISEVVCS
jgi:hypothetical protein